VIAFGAVPGQAQRGVPEQNGVQAQVDDDWGLVLPTVFEEGTHL
jgi:hypothetical protein